MGNIAYEYNVFIINDLHRNTSGALKRDKDEKMRRKAMKKQEYPAHIRFWRTKSKKRDEVERTASFEWHNSFSLRPLGYKDLRLMFCFFP